MINAVKTTNYFTDERKQTEDNLYKTNIHFTVTCALLQESGSMFPIFQKVKLDSLTQKHVQFTTMKLTKSSSLILIGEKKKKASALKQGRESASPN